MSGQKKRNQFFAEIVAFWQTLDTKPRLVDFAAQCRDRGWDVSVNVLKQWRMSGYLPGDLNGPGRRLGTAPIVAAIMRKAEGDAKEAAKESGTFSKTMVREICAKTLRCADVFLTRVIEEATTVQVKDANELAVLSNVAMQVMGKAAEVAEALQLLMVTEKNTEAERSDAGPVSLDERRAALGKRLGIERGVG
jgi:hypothetical protein